MLELPSLLAIVIVGCPLCLEGVTLVAKPARKVTVMLRSTKSRQSEARILSPDSLQSAISRESFRNRWQLQLRRSS